MVKRTPYVLQVAEDEGFFDIKAYAYDILTILTRKTKNLFDRKVVFEEEFLIIRQHDNKRNIENIL